jgi:IclR family KDG regulon transcriptional repressor
LDAQYERNFLKTLARGLRVFSAFTPDKPEASLTDIADVLDVDPSTASRFAYTLETLGYLDRDPETKLYRVSSKIFALTVSLAGPRNLRKISLSYMESLRDTTGETVVLGVRDAAEMVVIEVVETRHTLVPRGWIGGRVPVYSSALGKAVLAHLPQQSVVALLDNVVMKPFTQNTITERMTFLEELEHTRERGWSLNDEEYTEGVISVGAPIFSGSHGITGAVCIDVPTARITGSHHVQRLAEKIVATAKEISQRAGHASLE